jgi:hypothetical protein
MATTELTQERLKEVLNYNHCTGEFSPRNGVHRGRSIGSLDQGYIRITVDNRAYRAHRLAFLYMMGSFPEGLIDHKNGLRSDNKWLNLRECTHTQNRLNVKRQKKTGYKNVHWDKKTKCWLVKLQKNKRVEYFGYYKDEELAGLVAQEARNKYHGEFANHG